MNKIKKIQWKYGLVILFVFVGQIIMACPVCDREKANQMTFGLSHGAGPSHSWEWLIIIGMVLITLYALYEAIHRFIKPDGVKGEENKNSIFLEE